MRFLLFVVVACIAGSAIASESARELRPESATHFQESIRPVLVEHCSGCHDPEDDGNPVRFLTATEARNVAKQRGLWSSVAEQLRNRTMPPADEPQPTEQDRLRISEWIERTLRETACDQGEYAGAVMTRRLNRREYDNTIRDLLGVDLNASDAFPVDGSGGEGFDNNGETLFLPPILMERYLEAAADALDVAIITPPLHEVFGPNDLLPAPESKSDQPRSLAPRDEAAGLVKVYVAGEYTVRVAAAAQGSESARLVLKIDGIAADRFQAGTGTTHEAVVRLARGVHSVAVRCTGDAAVTVSRLEVRQNQGEPTDQQHTSHERLFGHPPGRVPEEPAGAAREIIVEFARRAFRRPLREGEVDRLMGLYERGAERGDPHEEAVKLALKAVLVSPHFLFRIEAEPTGTGLEPISDHELAVRLSYFLWSTMPDEELGRLADQGRLNRPDVLAAQVERMLDDPKSREFVDSFIGQWLGTREVGARVAPDTNTFRDEFTTELLLDLHDEPTHFFAHLIKENRSLLELIDSDYAVINRRLEIHYGLEDGKLKEKGANPWTLNPKRGSGGPFRVVELPDDRRGGVLGMGGVHMLTSYPDRTSPVLRGGWVLETLLGVHVPSPPPDVPELKRGKKEKKSVREQLAEHRDNASCAACHNLMDPLGFALDNFDVLGRWREKDGESPIDASAELPSGETFTGPAGLRRVLLERRDEFVGHLTRKMLGYALGRSLADGDDCTVQRIADRLKTSGYPSRALVREIVLSTPFQMRQGTEADVAAVKPSDEEKTSR